MSENEAKRMLDSEQDLEGHQVRMNPEPDGVWHMNPEPDGARAKIEGEDEDSEGHVWHMNPEPDGARAMIDGDDEDVEGHIWHY